MAGWVQFVDEGDVYDVDHTHLKRYWTMNVFKWHIEIIKCDRKNELTKSVLIEPIVNLNISVINYNTVLLKP